MSEDTRNVIDKYKGWQTELIREDVQTNVLPYSVLMVNLNYDFNFSTVVRNANAFGAKHVYYVSGSKKFDRRGTVGTHHYTNVTHLGDIHAVIPLGEHYNFVAVELTQESIPLGEFKWPRNPLMIFGSEGEGLTKEYLDICPQKVYIPMYGSVRSLNTACASAIVMRDFTEKYEKQTQNV